MQRKFPAGCRGIATLALAATSAKAIQPIDVLVYTTGPFALKPQLSVNETYNDNIFYRNEEKISDFITTISPGLDLQIGSKDYNFIEASYTYDQLFYARQDAQNADQHRLSLVSHFERSRIKVNGRDQFEMLASPLGGGISFRGEKVERTTYQDDYRLEYDFSPKTSPYLEFSHSTRDFQDDLRLYDSTTVFGTLGFDYRAFSRTAFFGEIYFGQTVNEPNTPPGPPLADYPTATFIGAFLGIRGNFTEKLTGSLKAGYEARLYSSDVGNSGLPVVEMNLTEQFSEQTILSFSYAHRQLESVQFARSPFTADTISASLLQQIGNEGRFRVNANASYVLSSFEPSPFFAEREDHLISAGLTLSYDFKLWLRAFLAYNFEHLDSTTPVVFDYDVNRVTIGMTLGY